MYGMYRTIFGWDTTIWKSGIWGCKKNVNIEKIAFKVVQMKFLAMHISDGETWKLSSFTVFTVIVGSASLHFLVKLNRRGYRKSKLKKALSLTSVCKL